MVDDNNVLLQNVTQYTLRCSNDVQSKEREPVPLHVQCNGTCIVRLPCQCEIITTIAFVPQKLENCDNKTVVPTVVHAVNLPAITAFLENSETRFIHGSTVFHELPQINIPPVRVFETNLSENIASIEHQNFALEKIAKAASRDATLYSSLAHAMLDRVDNSEIVPQPWSNTILYWINMLSYVLLALCILAIVVVSKKLYVLTTIIMAFQITRTQAMKIGFRTTPTATTTPPAVATTTPNTQDANPTVFPSWTDWMSYEQSEFIVQLLTLLILLTFATVQLAHKLYKIWHQKHQITEAMFSLEFGNENTSLIIPVAILKHPLSHYTFAMGSGLQKAKVAGYLTPKLTLHWPGLIVTNRHTTFQLQLHLHNINLSAETAIQCNNILHGSYYVLPCSVEANGTVNYLEWTAEDNSYCNVNHCDSGKQSPMNN